MLALSPDTVRRVTVKRQGESSAGVAVQRDADAAVWHLGDGATGQVMPEKLAAWLACVAVLKADRIEKLGVSPDDLDAYGLRNAWLEFSVDVDVADALRMSVLVGKEAGHGKRYAMVRARDVVFVLDAETLRTLSMRFVEPL